MKSRGFLYAAAVLTTSILSPQTFRAETPILMPPTHDPAVWGRAHQPYIATVMVSGSTSAGTPLGREREQIVFRDEAGRVREDTFYDSGQLMASTLRDPAKQTTVICMQVPKLATVLHALPPGYTPPGSGWVAAEALPAKRIAGINAPGQRFTRTFIVDGKTDAQVTDAWVAPDLGIVLEYHSSDSLHGSTSFRVTHLVLSTPDASLFTIPADYAIRDTEQGKH